MLYRIFSATRKFAVLPYNNILLIKTLFEKASVAFQLRLIRKKKHWQLPIVSCDPTVAAKYVEILWTKLK